MKSDKKITRCTRCVLSSTFPKIKFDENGVCNYCNKELFFDIEDDHIEKSKEEIRDLIDQYRGKGQYDAIVCYSGGKDSTYTLQLAIEKYDLRVLAFTLDNGFLSPQATQNIIHAVKHFDVDHYFFRPSWNLMRKLYKASALYPLYNPTSLIRISAGCNSCISMINISALKIAIEKSIPFIISGFTLGQIPFNSIVFRNNYNMFKESREASLAKLREAVGPEIDHYYQIPESVLDHVTEFPHNLNILCVETITEEDLVKAIEKIGWSKPEDVDGCSSNCIVNTFNNIIHERMFGFNPYELELSQLVRKGLLTREEAIDKIEDQPIDYFNDVIDILGITEDDLNGVESVYRKK